jgi:hypothetical protein
MWNVIAQVATFLLYLTDVEEGGETMFPYEVSADEMFQSIYQ